MSKEAETSWTESGRGEQGQRLRRKRRRRGIQVHKICLCSFLSLSFPLHLSLSFTHSHSLTHSLTHSLSLSLSHSLFYILPCSLPGKLKVERNISKPAPSFTTSASPSTSNPRDKLSPGSYPSHQPSPSEQSGGSGANISSSLKLLSSAYSDSSEESSREGRYVGVVNSEESSQVVSCPDPTLFEEKGLVKNDKILGS